MSDIRSFFGPKGGEAPTRPKPKPAPKEEAPKKGRPKGRKVVEDSEDEDQPVVQTKKPAKATPKKAKSANTIKGVETTASSYFASSKAKAAEPEATVTVKTNKAKPNPTLEVRMSPRTKQGAAPKRAPAQPKSEPKKAARKKTTVTYAGPEDDDEDAYMDDNEDAADDIHAADAKGRNMGKNDDYAEDESEEEFVPKPKRLASRGKPAVIKAASESDDFEDHQLDADDMNLDDEEPAKPKGKKAAAATKKRKATAVTSDDDDDDDTQPRKKKAPAKPHPSSKGKKAAEKPEPARDRAVEEILANVPLVTPPKPPPKGSDDEGKKKFDFRAGQANIGPAPMQGQCEIPEGEDNCLLPFTFVFTGLLQTIGREEGQALVKRYGGKVTTTPSGKTSYVVLGEDAGPSKLEKIQKLGLKTINEEGLFYLVKNMPVGGGTGEGAALAKKKRDADQEKVEKAAAELEEQEKQQQAEKEKAAKKAAAVRGTAAPQPTQPLAQLWTTKYAPTQLSHICGNKSQVERIQKWLREWQKCRKYDFKKRGPDGMGAERAIIISGPPGIGKTTAAHLAAKLEGYDIIESNASDTRSKKLVEGGVSQVINNTSLLGFFAGDGKKVDAGKKIVLIMDEVDGMSAGDRGGVGALAKFCKKTEVPLILICNERRLPKMKPFDHAAFDIKFVRPSVIQVRSRIMTICHREGLKLPPQAVDSLIEGTHTDIRQIINMLSTVKLDQTSINFEDSKAMSKAWEKHVILKPWDIVQKIISGGLFAPASKATLNDKIELYFNDHEFSPLMFQENYIKALPALLPPKNSSSPKERNLKHLELIDQAAESISDGDLVDRMIHGPQQHWTLMPTHAIMSTVRPASFIAGQLIGATFTSWLGNNSTFKRLERCLREIHSHMRLRTSGDHNEVRQQYLPVLWDRLVMRLKNEGKDGVDDMIKLMDSYYLTREDWASIRELGVGHQKDQKVEKKEDQPAKKWGQREEPKEEAGVVIDPLVKAAFTRRYNTMSHPVPYMKASTDSAPRRAVKEKPDLEEAVEGDDDAEVLEPVETNNGDDDLEKDKYIKKPKAKGAKKGAATKAGDGDDDDGDSKAAKGKGKARGRPKKK